MIIDEFTTRTFVGLDTIIAAGRSNKIATTIATQDASQLKLHYSKELADVIINIYGNVIVGQVGGEIAKQISERLGKTLQDRERLSINSNDTSVSHSKQLEVAVPVSTISNLSSGEFVGTVADNPEQAIDLKTFHCKIINDHKLIAKERRDFMDLPTVRTFDKKEIAKVYLMIKQDVQDIMECAMGDILGDPAKANFILSKDIK